LALILVAVFLAGCAGRYVPPPPAAGAVFVLNCEAPCERTAAKDSEPARLFEPTIATDPSNPDHWVAAVTEFSGPSESNRTDLVYVTFDAGGHWSRVTLPNLARSTDRAMVSPAVDPAVSIAPDGAVVFSDLAIPVGAEPIATAPFLVPYELGSPSTPFLDASVYVARSSDGGRTFTDARLLAEGTGGCADYSAPVDAPVPGACSPATVSVDKPGYEIASGPAGEVMVTWTERDCPVPNSCAFAIRYSLTEDGGSTWSAPRTLAQSSSEYISAASPAISPDGNSFAVAYLAVSNSIGFALASSTDRGSTWNQTPIRDNLSFAWPALRWHESRGQDWLYLAGANGSFSRQSPVLLTSARNGTAWGPWSKPVALDQPEADGNIMPALSVDSAGWAYVGFYHAINTTAHPSNDGSRERFEVVLVPGAAAAGALPGASPQSLRVSEEAIRAENYSIYGLGHYIGMASVPNGTVSAWIGGTGPTTFVNAARVERVVAGSL
jgi:hypothetical protein